MANTALPRAPEAPKKLTHEMTVKANKLVARAKELVHEGNARRIIIKNADGIALIEVPLTVGVAASVLEPVWVALGALAALTAHYRIEVHHREEAAGKEAHFGSRADV